MASPKTTLDLSLSLRIHPCLIPRLRIHLQPLLLVNRAPMTVSLTDNTLQLFAVSFILYLIFSVLFPTHTFRYPWLPVLCVLVVLVPDPGNSPARDPTWQTRCDKKRLKWLRHNRRFLRSGFGRYRPIFFPPYAPPRIDLGDRIVLRFRLVFSRLIRVILRSALLLLGDPFLFKK